MGTRLFVGGLPWAADERALGEAFSAFGSVTDVKVIRDPETGKSRGFGFVALSTAEECANAIRQMDGAMIGGRRVTVREAQDRGGPGPGPGGGRPGPDRGERPAYRGPPPDRGAPPDRREQSYDNRPPRPPMDRPPMDRDQGPRPPMDRPPRADGPPRGPGGPPAGPGRSWGGGGGGGGFARPSFGGPPGGGPGWGGGGGGGPGPGGGEAEGWSSDRGAQRRAGEGRWAGPDKKKPGGKRFDDWGAGRVDEKPRSRREKGRRSFEDDWVDEDDEG